MKGCIEKELEGKRTAVIIEGLAFLHPWGADHMLCFELENLHSLALGLHPFLEDLLGAYSTSFHLGDIIRIVKLGLDLDLL